ncbi:hypothetical protein [Streptomyces sp. SAS_270]|uniref:hypothetical protein n=1 Tax=Streptomyces sp. SAS_270 TaxID=3412748 RepID=UPI00403D35D1
MINPEGIPHFTGDLGLLEHHVTGLQNDADGIRRAGEVAHTRFQALAAVYQAPEATDLFASTAPVRDRADAFAGKVETVAAALTEYAVTVKPIKERLEALKVKAAAFVASVDKDVYRGSGEWTHGPVDNDWTKNQDKVDEHTALMNGVAEAKAAFEAAEIAAHNKITALVGGTQYMQQSDHMLVPIGTQIYGATAETYEQVHELPWGTPQGLAHSGWDLGYQIKEHVWDGFVMDGVVGTLDGAFTMVGGHGTDQAKLAWEGLTRAIVGGETYLQESSGKPATGFWAGDFAQESKPYAKETGKGFLKWDMWSTNPARASGSVVTFNLLPFAGTAAAVRVAAAGGKAGAGTRAVLTAARIADAVDPISTAVRTTRYTLPKISELTANVRSGLGEFRAAKGPESLLELSDGSQLRIADGEFTASKNNIPHTGDVPQELSATERTTSATEHAAHVTAREQEPALVGAGARVAEGGGHAGEDLSAQARHDSPASDTRREATRGSEVQGDRATGASGASHGAGDGPVAGRGASGTGLEHSRPQGGATRSTGPDEHSADHTNGDDAQSERQQELTPAERKAIQDEHVRKANEDPEWRRAHYDILGRRKPNVGLVDGVELPQLAKDPQGRLVAKHNLPTGPSEVRLGPKPLPRGTAPDDVLSTLDKRAADRQAYRDLMNAQKAFDGTPSAPNHEALATAQESYAKQLGHVPPNSKISEKLGEDASRLHAIPHEFPDAEVIKLPKTSNGAHMFDAAYRIKDDRILIAEDKAPGNDLDWRHGRADPEDPANPHIGDDGGAAGMRVKQGTLLYLRTIMAEMTKRGGRDAVLARQFRSALKAGKLRYVLVKAKEPDGSLYAGAVVEEMQIY